MKPSGHGIRFVSRVDGRTIIVVEFTAPCQEHDPMPSNVCAGRNLKDCGPGQNFMLALFPSHSYYGCTDTGNGIGPDTSQW